MKLKLFLLILLWSTAVGLQAQTCSCVCSGATGLPDPLIIPTAANLPECQIACSDLMYANALFFLNCTCTGAPLAPDPSPPAESSSEGDCTTGCAMLGYTSSACTPVPVELVFFEGEKIEGNFVVLHWQTATEINNAGFEVERSQDGLNWQTLDFVKGHATTLEVKNYKWQDDTPLAGVSYYRLRQLDQDGSEEYSPIISIDLVNKGKQPSLLTWPNPAQDYLQFQLVDTEVYQGETIFIYNYFGVLLGALPVQQFDMRLNEGRLYVGNLPKGLYILSIQLERLRLNRTFMKQ